MITEKIQEYFTSKIKDWPCNSNRSSELGHPCERYLVFLRTRGKDKALHDWKLQSIFNEGNIHEQAVLRLLQDVGFQIIEQQRPFEMKEQNITGHVDAKMLVNGSAIPVEIKSCSPYVFKEINTIEDLFNGKYLYLRKYPAQITLYLLLANSDEGYFILKNKLTGELKEIPIVLDYEYAESLLQKAERVNKYIKENIIPDVIPYEEEICGQCGFLHVCLPEIKRDSLEITNDVELEKDIERLDELKPLVSEYNKIDSRIKEKLREKEKVVIGHYLVQGKWIERKSYTVEGGKYWKTKILDLNLKGEDNGL